MKNPVWVIENIRIGWIVMLVANGRTGRWELRSWTAGGIPPWGVAIADLRAGEIVLLEDVVTQADQYELARGPLQ